MSATEAAYQKLRAAAEEGLQAIIQRGDGSARIFQPLDPDKPLGTVAANMELVRFCAAEWPRTNLPYEAAAITAEAFLPFAYAAERACRAAKRYRAAQIWAFVRRAPVDARELAAGYPVKGGGMSRILMAARSVNTSEGLRSFRVHCTPEMLTFEKPIDTIAFARSELWPVYDEWKDGWATIDKKVAVLRRLNAAWRGESVSMNQVIYGLLGAGQTLSAKEIFVEVVNSNLEGIDLRGASLNRIVLGACRFKGSDFQDVSMEDANIKHCYFDDCRFVNANFYSSMIFRSSMLRADLRGAKIEEARLEGVNFSEANLERAVLDKSTISMITFVAASMIGASFQKCAAEEADFSKADLREANFTKTNASSAIFRNADLRDAKFTGARLTYAKLDGAQIDGADFTDAKRMGSDPLIPGWATKPDTYVRGVVKLMRA